MTSAFGRSSRQVSILLVLVTCMASGSWAETFQLVSRLPVSQPPPAGGSGDSWTPVTSPDGRFVLYSSTANNLVLTTNNTDLPGALPPSLNVFLRDRVQHTTTLVSVNLSGVAGGNGDSLPADISPDGRFALFESSASDLVAGDTNGFSDIFVRDLWSNLTVLVSVATNGLAGSGTSRTPSMTPDGRFVAFVSTANNLVPGDTNAIADIFVRDLQSGTTVLASVGARPRTGTTMTVSTSEAPLLTPDGRYVAFYSTATNLVPAVPAGGDVYVRDLVGNTTVWASADARAATWTALHTTNVGCYNHAISTDGQWLAYEASPTSGTLYPGLILRYNLGSDSTDVVHSNAVVPIAAFEDIHNLDLTPDGRFIAFNGNLNGTNGTTTGILVWDGQFGSTALASGDPLGNFTTNALADWPNLDPSGRYVTFVSSATNLVANSTPGEYHIYVHDLQSGTTTLVDADTNGVGSAVSPATVPHLTDDGHTVVYECPDGGQVPNDRNRDFDVFARDRLAGSAELISAHHPTLSSVTPNGLSTLSPYSVNSDGRYVAFTSEADNLVPNDTNQCRDIFVRDLVTGSVTLVSVDTNGFAADGISSDPVISADGRYVAFTSSADNLVSADANNVQDIFLRDLQAGTTTLVSANSAGTGSGNKASTSPLIGAGGRYVVFLSSATDLAPLTPSGQNAFIRDLQLNTTRILPPAGASSTFSSRDGRFVGLLSAGGATVWDLVANVAIYTNGGGSLLIYGGGISADGSRLALWTQQGGIYTLSMVDFKSNTQWSAVSGMVPGSHLSLAFNADARTLVFTAKVSQNGTNQVYFYDDRSGAPTLVSHDLSNPSSPASSPSDRPDISADGRFIAFQSSATNLVARFSSGLPAIFLYDRQTGSNTLLSADQFGGLAPDNRSLTPVFSADGSTLFFQSWASDLASGDFNHNSDLFGFTFLLAGIFPSLDPNHGPWLSWPWVAGKNYRVESRDSLAATAWLPLGGVITNLGTKAWVLDPAPPAGQRFYRIVSF